MVNKTANNTELNMADRVKVKRKGYKRVGGTVLTLESVHKDSREQWWLVRERDSKVEVGMLVKGRNTRTDTHPYKVLGLIEDGLRPFLGAFYEEDGGKEAAMQRLAIYRDELMESGRITE